MKKIVLISVGQPSTNPRLVKEADTLQKAGFDVYVIYSYWTKWAWEADQLLFKKVTWKHFLVGGSPFENKLSYFFTRLRVKLFWAIAKNITLKYGVAEVARGRTYPELLRKAKSLKADLYIAHIQAALPAAVKAAQKYHAKCGFDAEDFHRQEVSDDVNEFYYKISSYIEDKYLPQVDYFTASSPLIAEHYNDLYHKDATCILNAFPGNDAISIAPGNQKPLKLFWFSQTIGPERGVETIIEALKRLKGNDIELHLLGYSTAETRKVFSDMADMEHKAIHFHDPIPPGELIGFASQFDIGLATENSVPLNRDICLTNKIFTYVQAGLAVIASDTTAQAMLLDQYPRLGKTYKKNDPQSLAEPLAAYCQNSARLLEAREAALHTGQTELNWENESKKFMNVIETVLSAPAK